MNNNLFFTWRTNKIENGFRYTVEEIKSFTEKQDNGTYAQTKIIKTGVCRTRARATRFAKQWKMYFKKLNDLGKYKEID